MPACRAEAVARRVSRDPCQSVPAGDLVQSDGHLCDPVLVVDLARPVDPGWLRAAVAERRVLVGFVHGTPHPFSLEMAASMDVTFVPAAGSGEWPRCVVPVEDPLEAAYGLAERICDRPLAAMAFVETLRLTSAVASEQGLAIESYAYSALLAGEEFRTWRAGTARRPVVVARDQLVRVERDEDVLRIQLDHPERRNTYSALLRDQLVEALRIARLDPTVKLVELSGTGPSFCSGGDLDEFGTTPDPVLAHLIRTTAGAAPIMLGLGDRLAVHVHGPCVGAGIELAAFGQRVVASPDLTVWMPEVTMGLMPGAGGTVSLPRRIGRWRTAYLVLSASRIGADTALRWGLVDEIAS